MAPAAASMDVFTDYAHRGRAFAEAARELAGAGDGPGDGPAGERDR
jgi:UDP-N-acetylmuramoylalanine--D-glutamate ligase